MSLNARWQKILDELRSLGRYRSLQRPTGHDFTSNDYLGYGAAPPWDATIQARSGIASRLLRGHHDLWDDVELRLARWHGAEASLVFNSGYVANEGLLSTIITHNDWVASDQFNHASIIDGLRLSKAERFIYRHGDIASLDAELTRLRSVQPNRECFIVTESLFSMDGDQVPLLHLAEVADRLRAHLIVDEAHATGCLGPHGSGLVDHHNLRGRVLATVHTGGKALGVPGAYVAGSALLREILINRCRHLIFTTALPPQVAAWWLNALERVIRDDDSRDRLARNTRHFRRRLAELGVSAGGDRYIVPILIGDDARAVAAADHLQAAGFDVRAIRPPTVPAGTSRLRVSIHADQDEPVILALAELLAVQVHWGLHDNDPDVMAK